MPGGAAATRVSYPIRRYDDGPEPSPVLRNAEDVVYVHARAAPLSLGEKRNRLVASGVDLLSPEFGPHLLC